MRSVAARRHGRRIKGKMILLAFVLLVVCAAGAPVLANPFVDVPAGHWAYRALEQLADASLIDGYSTGFFTGARRLTRYEIALSVAGALSRLSGEEPLSAAADQRDLDRLIVDYNRRQPQRPLTAAEGDLLRAVVVEFRDELSMLGYTVPAVAASAPHSPGMEHQNAYVLDSSYQVLARQRLLAARTDGVSGDGTPDPVAEAGGPGDEQRQVGSARIAEVTQRAAGISSGVALGRIGSTVLLAETPGAGAQVQAWERTTMPLLDGAIHLSEYGLPGGLLLGAAGRTALPPFWPGTETLVGVESVVVAPHVSLAGQRARRSNLTMDTGAAAVRATVLLGEDVAVAGSVRTVEPGFEDEDGDAVGIGLSVRLGDVQLTTGREIVQRSGAEESERVTSWTLEYSLAEAARVRAGWQSVSDTRSRASVDVNVPVPQGALRFGLAYEGERERELEEGVSISMTTLTMAGLDLRVADNAEARAAFSLQQESGVSTERTASLGLRYALSPEAALLLGYKFINFNSVGEGDDALRPESVTTTTAEFSIRF